MMGFDFFNGLGGQTFSTQYILSVIFVTCFVLYLIIGIFKFILYRMRLRDLEIAMIKFPNYADVRYKIAEVYYNYGKFDLAERFYREALSIYQYNNMVRIKLGMLLIDQMEKTDEGFAELARVRFGTDSDKKAKFVVDSYLVQKNLYDKFHSKYGQSAGKGPQTT